MKKKTLFVRDAEFHDDKQIRVIGLNVAIGLRQRCFELKKKKKKKKKAGNRMPPVNCFDDYLTGKDITETIQRLDRISWLFVAILHRKYSQRYNKTLYIP